MNDSDTQQLRPIVHVKITDHFLQQARERMTKRDRAALADLLLSEHLVRVCESMPRGDRGAASLGDGLLVFMRDVRDDRVLAVLTYLGPDESHVVDWRRDTTYVQVDI
jgi:hypothetical protein